MKRKGMGKGTGKGYKNMVGKDPMVHSDSAKGIKQPQRVCAIPPSLPNNPKDLAGLIKKKYADDLKQTLIKIQTDEGLKNRLSFEGKTYQGSIEEQREKFKKFLISNNKKRMEQDLSRLQRIKSVEDFDSPLIVTIEWKSSRMWGSNPRAYSNTGFQGSSIGGCGYDKRSTALAEALNDHLPLLKKMVQEKEKKLKKAKPDADNSELLGYGSGYGIIPNFEGGVGVGSHRRIIEGLGLKFQESGSGKNTDVYIISK